MLNSILLYPGRVLIGRAAPVNDILMLLLSPNDGFLSRYLPGPGVSLSLLLSGLVSWPNLHFGAFLSFDKLLEFDIL